MKKGVSLMIVKKLDYDDIINYYEDLFNLMIDVYRLNFNIKSENVKEICEDKINSLKQYINDGTAIFYGILEEEKLIGFLWSYVHDYFDEKRLHLTMGAIDKDFRNRGLIKVLFYRAFEEAKQLGIKVVDMMVSETNEKIIHACMGAGAITERRLLKIIL